MKYLLLRSAMRWTAAAAVALLSSGAARANETYLLHLSGGGTHFLDAWECPMQFCVSPVRGFSWEGTVTVVVDSDGPGTFAGEHFVSLAMTSGSFIEGFSGHSFFAPPSVTIAGGQVTDIEADWAGSPPAHVTFSGLSVHYTRPPTHHFGDVFANAGLQAIPEPATAALLLGGLAVMGAAALRRRPSR